MRQNPATWKLWSESYPSPIETYIPPNWFISHRGWLRGEVCWWRQIPPSHRHPKVRVHHFRRLEGGIILRNQPQMGLWQAHIRYIYVRVYIFVFCKSTNISTPVNLSMSYTLLPLVNMGRHPKNQRHKTPSTRYQRIIHTYTTSCG